MSRKIAGLLILISLASHLFGQTPARRFEGSWQGTIDVGQKLRLALTVSKSPDGAYSGKFDSLDQGSSIPIEIVKVRGDSIRLELQTVGALFEGKLNADGSGLIGQFSQGGSNLPLTFKRGPATAAETPKPSPYIANANSSLGSEGFRLPFPLSPPRNRLGMERCISKLNN